jgi:hypothetical protein
MSFYGNCIKSKSMTTIMSWFRNLANVLANIVLIILPSIFKNLGMYKVEHCAQHSTVIVLTENV